MSENKEMSNEINETFDERHGGPYDRGAADSWYRRGCLPHYYVEKTGSSDRVERADMTEDEIRAYNAGFAENDESGGHKEW